MFISYLCNWENSEYIVFVLCFVGLCTHLPVLHDDSGVQVVQHVLEFRSMHFDFRQFPA